MKKIFRGNSLEICLRNAAVDLGIDQENLNYNILENKKGFFKRKVVIEVYGAKEKNDSKTVPSEKHEVKNSNGTISVSGSVVTVKDPDTGGSPAVIEKGEHMKLFVDGEEVEKSSEVFSNNKIQVIFDEVEASRHIDIYTSEDKMEAFLEVSYIPKKVYALEDAPESQRMVLHLKVADRIYPPAYTFNEIKDELSKSGIVYGIIEENLGNITAKNNKKITAALGKKVVNGEDDFIEIKFKTSSSFKEDEVGNIDFKSIGLVNSVGKGDVIAVKHPGKSGQDGCDVTGRKIKSKEGKKISIKAGAGCVKKDENTIAALIAGKPSFNGNVFYVKQVHELNNDVDLKTGNICFLGDISIHGGIKEGMEIDCGNNLIVDKDVERAKISARGNIVVKGSIVASEVSGGGEDVKKIKAVKHLMEFRKVIEDLISAVKEMKMYNLLGEGKKDGEIIKILIESKFKNLIKLCIDIIADLSIGNESGNKDKVVGYIRTRLMGMAPISIKSYTELRDVLDSVDEKISDLQDTLKLPVKIVMSYCQNSDVESSGDIVITGKGEYISTISANGSVEFTKENSVARGGSIKAKSDVKCRIVGSVAGVTTKIEVGDDGNIWADVAYHNTVMKVGNKEAVLDSPSKDVHVYLKDDNIVVDKLLL
jgi:hypothetical protein